MLPLIKISLLKSNGQKGPVIKLVTGCKRVYCPDVGCVRLLVLQLDAEDLREWGTFEWFKEPPNNVKVHY